MNCLPLMHSQKDLIRLMILLCFVMLLVMNYILFRKGSLPHYMTKSYKGSLPHSMTKSYKGSLPHSMTKSYKGSLPHSMTKSYKLSEVPQEFMKFQMGTNTVEDHL